MSLSTKKYDAVCVWIWVVALGLAVVLVGGTYLVELVQKSHQVGYEEAKEASEYKADKKWLEEHFGACVVSRYYPYADRVYDDYNPTPITTFILNNHLWICSTLSGDWSRVNAELK